MYRTVFDSFKVFLCVCALLVDYYSYYLFFQIYTSLACSVVKFVDRDNVR